MQMQWTKWRNKEIKWYKCDDDDDDDRGFMNMQILGFPCCLPFFGQLGYILSLSEAEFEGK